MNGSALLHGSSATTIEETFPIGLLSVSCPYPRPEVIHCFDSNEMEAVARRADVIVAHGVDDDVPGFDLCSEHVELCPVFAPAARGVPDVGRGDLATIFALGEGSWRALGGHGGALGLLLHGGDLQRRSLVRLLSLTLAGEQLAGRARRVRYLPDYEALAAAAAQSTDCLVVGLRRLDVPGYRRLAIDGADVRHHDAYPLRMAVRVLARPTADAMGTARRFLAEMRNRIAACWAP
jgi:hypothetical protein